MLNRGFKEQARCGNGKQRRVGGTCFFLSSSLGPWPAGLWYLSIPSSLHAGLGVGRTDDDLWESPKNKRTHFSLVGKKAKHQVLPLWSTWRSSFWRSDIFLNRWDVIRQASLIPWSFGKKRYELAWSEVVLVSATMPHEVLEMTHKLLGFRVLEWKRPDEPKLDHAMQVKFLTDSMTRSWWILTSLSGFPCWYYTLPRKRKMEAEDHPLEKNNYIPNFHFGVQTVVGGNMIGGDRPSTLSTQTYLRLWQKDLTTKILGSTGHGFRMS